MMHDPDSVTLRSAGDVRQALMLGRMFVMQVAHPDVGRGVAEHSAFARDPWTRLRAIAASGQRFVFSGAAAAQAEGERLRAAHRDIAGRRGDGSRYHALQPAAYGWVHAVFLDTTLAMHALYGEPLGPVDRARLFAEWREGGALLGLRARDLPDTLEGFEAWYRGMIATTLEVTPVVELLLAGAPPPAPGWAARWPAGLWQRAWAPLGGWSRWLTRAGLPPAFRDRLPARYRWTADDERRLRGFAAGVRTIVPRLPARLRLSREAYAAGAR